jgi:hypothetical protein
VISPGLQLAVTLGGVQLAEADPLQPASQLNWAMALTVHCPPDTCREHSAEAPASLLRMAEMAAAAFAHSVWTSIPPSPEALPPPASLPPPAPASAVLMFSHAVPTEFCRLVAMTDSWAAAETNAEVLASSPRLAMALAAASGVDAEMAVLNPLHPCAAPAIVLAALHPPLLSASAPMEPASTSPGTNLKALRCIIGSSPLGARCPEMDTATLD